MQNRQSSLRRLAEAGLIAAMYAALSLVLPLASFGIVQCRLAEALTILAAFTPAAIPGLAVGCFITNLAGLGMGVNPAGAWDLLWGPLATLLAAWLTWRLRSLRIARLPLLSTLPPVIINAVVVGTELTLVSPQATWQVWGDSDGQCGNRSGGGLHRGRADSVCGARPFGCGGTAVRQKNPGG